MADTAAGGGVHRGGDSGLAHNGRIFRFVGLCVFGTHSENNLTD